MTRTAGLILFLVTAAGPLFGQAEPAAGLLDDSDVKKLSGMIADYYAARQGEDLKSQAKQIELFQDLNGELPKVAKRKKVETILQSPVDLRRIFSAPVHPAKSVKKGAYYDTEYTFDQATYRYLLRIPKDYATNHSIAFPLLVLLHPLGMRDDEVKKWLAEAVPESVAETVVVVAPMNVEMKTSWTSDLGRTLAITSFRDATIHYKVDRGRIFLYGEGDTAAAAIEYVTAFPGFFSGAVLRGVGTSPRTDKLVNVRYLPLLVLTEPATGDQTLTEFVDAAKAQSVNVQVQEITPTDKGGMGDAGAQALAAFVAETRKEFAPANVRFVMDDPRFLNAYWLSVYDVDMKPGQTIVVEGEIDRAQNEIRVTTPPDVRTFLVYVNDDLVDLGKTVKLVHTIGTGEDAKSEVRFEGTLARNLEKTMNIWFNVESGNLGEVYTNAIEVRVAP